MLKITTLAIITILFPICPLFASESLDFVNTLFKQNINFMSYPDRVVIIQTEDTAVKIEEILTDVPDNIVVTVVTSDTES